MTKSALTFPFFGRIERLITSFNSAEKHFL